MAWQTPKTNWGVEPVGVGDFNRIEGNTKYLKGQTDGLTLGLANVAARGHVIHLSELMVTEYSDYGAANPLLKWRSSLAAHGKTVHFEAILKKDSAGGYHTGYAQLYNLTTNSAIVTVSTTSSNFAVVTSPAIIIPDGHVVGVRLATGGGGETCLLRSYLVIL